MVTEYEFDENLLYSPQYNVMHYNGPTEEWLRFVVSNRRNSSSHSYDMAMGPVANDSLYATITMYEKGDLSAEAAVVQLRTHTLFDQLSFHTKDAARLLRFVRAIDV